MVTEIVDVRKLMRNEQLKLGIAGTGKWRAQLVVRFERESSSREIDILEKRSNGHDTEDGVSRSLRRVHLHVSADHHK